MIVRTSISGMFAGVGGEDALAEAAVRVRRASRSHDGLARERDQAVVGRFRARDIASE